MSYFHSSLIFTDNVRSLPSEWSSVTRIEVTKADKHTSLLRNGIKLPPQKVLNYRPRYQLHQHSAGKSNSSAGSSSGCSGWQNYQQCYSFKLESGVSYNEINCYGRCCQKWQIGAWTFSQRDVSSNTEIYQTRPDLTQTNPAQPNLTWPALATPPVACIIKLLRSSFVDRHKWRQYHKHGE